MEKIISLVIPVYIVDTELERLTRECLLSLDGQYDELVVVDDASPLEVKWLKKKADKYIRHTQNQKFVKTINDGIRASEGTHICLINNDTKLIRGSLRDLKKNSFSFPLISGKDYPKWDGAFYMFPNKKWALHDERFIHYFSDLDRFYEAHLMGRSLHYVTSVEVFHHEQQTNIKSPEAKALYEEDKKKFEDKWGIPFLEAYAHLI